VSQARRSGIWLVCLRFDTSGYTQPALERVADDEDLTHFLARARRDSKPPLGSWPLHPSPDTHQNAHAWLRASTPASIAYDSAPCIVQSVTEEPDGSVTARYLFDAEYVAAHPEAIDPEHLGILHGTLAAKILDDGLVVLEKNGLAASLRWPSVRKKGTRLTRGGARMKRS
jgi:hypothetical protein